MKKIITILLVAFAINSMYSQTTVFSTVGIGQSYIVPAGVDSIQVKAWGAAGGAYTPLPNVGGGGGFAGAKIAVTPGEILTVNIGGGGTTTGGINGGGPSPSGAGGGGSTDLMRGTNYLIIAGGGGGAGNGTGGSGGGWAGTGSTVCSTPCVGGNQSTGGCLQGVGGTNGSAHQGGLGQQGGGGGGYYGGGGGSTGCGGGGGSGYIAPGAVDTILTTAPWGNYPFVGGPPANTADPDYNGTAGQGNQGTAGNGGLLVILNSGLSIGVPSYTNKSKIIFSSNINNGSFAIETNSSEKLLLKIFSINGEEVLSQLIKGTTTIDAGYLSNGIYTISVSGDDGVVNKKMVIIK